MAPAVMYVSGLGKIGIHKKGKMRGGASILLNQGGAGAASSYPSLDDYIKETGRNPLVPVSGNGLGRKLESLSLGGKQLKPKVKNIKFNL